jgi:hypothetical protein
LNDSFLSAVLHYGGACLEVGLLLYVIARRRLRSYLAPVAYVTLILAADFARYFVLFRVGASTRLYYYTYWLTDYCLALGSFLLVCALFRRACRNEEKIWGIVRPMLPMTFILVLGISVFSLPRSYKAIYSRGFINGFEQNLYFTCLVLVTLLYILIQQTQSADDELGLLVTGMGIQFAGPTATFALTSLLPDQKLGPLLLAYFSPLCNLLMFVTWFYVFVRLPKHAKVGFEEKAPAWAESALSP